MEKTIAVRWRGIGMIEGAFPEAAAVLERVLRAKRRRRRSLARLSIEKKVRVVLELQRTTNDIRRRCGRRPLPEWRI